MVGANVLKLWAKAISSLLTDKTRELICVNEVFIHGNFIAIELYKIVLLSIRQTTQTRYKSVFMGVCSSLVETSLNLKSLLPKRVGLDLSKEL